MPCSRNLERATRPLKKANGCRAATVRERFPAIAREPYRSLTVAALFSTGRRRFAVIGSDLTRKDLNPTFLALDFSTAAPLENWLYALYDECRRSASHDRMRC